MSRVAGKGVPAMFPIQFDCMTDEERIAWFRPHLAIVHEIAEQIHHAQTPDGNRERVPHSIADRVAKATATCISISMPLPHLIGKPLELAVESAVLKAVRAIPLGYSCRCIPGT